MFVSTKLRKIKRFYLFLCIFVFCFHLHKLESIHQYVFTKKYLMIYTTSTQSKLYWLLLFDFHEVEIIVAITYSSFTLFLPRTVKFVSIMFNLQEIENVVWKWEKNIYISSCIKRQMLLGWILCLQKWILTLDFENSLKFMKFCDSNFHSERLP